MTRVRPATAADIRRCRAIQTAALSDPWPGLLRPAITGPARTLVCEDGHVVGYVVALAAGQGPAYLPELAVAPVRQGQGYGSTLLTALLGELVDAGVATVRLTVRADDERALGFYRERDFRVIERRPGHYDDADGLLLERALGE